MAFSEPTKNAAFKRSGGQCECRRSTHPHGANRCPTKVSQHGARYHHITSQEAGGSNSPGNCQVLCVTCHELTRPYGSQLRNDRFPAIKAITSIQDTILVGFRLTGVEAGRYSGLIVRPVWISAIYRCLSVSARRKAGPYGRSADASGATIREGG